MGAAMIWIMLFHAELHTGIEWLDTFCSLGFAGTDIFFFLSGVGIYLSLSNSDGLLSYYKKRFVRIMPMYWCFIVFWIAFRFYIDKMTWPAAFLNVLGIEAVFDIQMAFNWYISFLLIFYIIAPLIRIFIDIAKAPGTIALMCLLLYLGYAVIENSNVMIGFARLPVFIMGMFFGKKMADEPDGSFSAAKVIVLALLIPVGCALTLGFKEDFMWGWHTGMSWYPLLLSTPGLCLVQALIFEHLPAAISGAFSFVGRHTLSIYMIHLFFYEIYNQLLVVPEVLETKLWHYPIIWVLVAAGCMLLEATCGLITKSRAEKPSGGIE